MTPQEENAVLELLVRKILRDLAHLDAATHGFALASKEIGHPQLQSFARSSRMCMETLRFNLDRFLAAMGITLHEARKAAYGVEGDDAEEAEKEPEKGQRAA